MSMINFKAESSFIRISMCYKLFGKFFSYLQKDIENVLKKKLRKS